MKLKELIDDDINLIDKWLDKPYIINWFINKESWMNEIKNRNTYYNFIHHFIVYIDNTPIGFCQYYDYRLGKESWHGSYKLSQTYSIDYLIGEEEYLKKGNGVKLVKLLTEKIFNDTNALDIIVQPDKMNIKSRRTLKSAGYVYDLNNDLFYINK